MPVLPQDIREGPCLGAVIELSGNALNSDLVYLIIQHGDQLTSYKAVISWGDATIDREMRNKILPGFHR